MLHIQIILMALLSLILNSNSLLYADVKSTPNKETFLYEDKTEQPPQSKAIGDLISSVLEPLPGSHFDKNGNVVIDDPEVYQRALDEEKANSKNPILESNEVKPEPEFKLFSWETLIGGIIGAVILFSSILICQINDYFKKKK